jgi:TonB-dependent receptor
MNGLRKGRGLLLGTTMLVSVTGMMAAPASAEEAMETVVVTGIKASLESALEIKKNSDQVVDSITAVDIGALPDSSVAESLQRVPGIQITRTDQASDPMRWAGFGNGVFVRGLSWVKTLTNGHEIFSAESGRSISFADISSDLMAGLDVYKNPNAKMIEGGVGGTVDLKTRKPFDFRDNKLAATGSLSYGDISDTPTGSVNVLGSSRFNTKVGEVGVLVSVDYQNMTASNNLVASNAYRFSGTVDGETVYYPGDTQNKRTQIAFKRMDWKQPRLALDATLQWRPTERLDVEFTALFTKASPQATDHGIFARINDNQAALNAYNYSDDGSWTGGTISNSEVTNKTRYQVRHHITAMYSTNVHYTPTDRLDLTFDAQYVDSRSYEYSMQVESQVKNDQWCLFASNGNKSANCSNGTKGVSGSTFYSTSPEINYTFDVSQGTPRFAFNSDATTAFGTQSNQLWSAAMDHYENNYAHSWATRADASYDLTGTVLGGWIKNVDAGFRANLKQATSRRTNYNYNRTSFQTWSVGYKSTYTASKYASALGDMSTQASDFSELYQFGDVLGQKMPAVWMAKASSLKNVWTTWKAIQSMESTSAQLGLTDTMFKPLPVAAGCTQGAGYRCMAMYNSMSYSALGSTGNGGGTDIETENTYAGYSQINFKHDNLFGFDVPFDGNAGVRIVRSQTGDAGGYLLLPSVSSCGSVDTTGTLTCTDRAGAYSFVNNGGASAVATTDARSNGYTDILPSFNIRASLADRLLLRLAYSKGVVRPAFSMTQNYANLTYTFGSGTDIGTFSTLYGGKTGTAGNPDLKPLHASNYDLSLEWYFAEASSLSVALFYKDVSDYFMSGIVPMAITRNNITETFYVTSYVNGSKGKVQGLEVAYQQFFAFLPGALSGLGFQANYTKLYNSGGKNVAGSLTSSGDIANGADATLPMEGMSNDSANAALMYEKYGISGRLTYNWRSRFLMNSSAANIGQPVWQRGYGQVDGSLMYTYQEHYKIGVQTKNILKQSTVLEVGSVAYHPAFQWVEGERQLSLILRANW